MDFADVVASWQNAQAICFDVNSIVCKKDGIDEVVAFCRAGEAVTVWTARSTRLFHSMC